MNLHALIENHCDFDPTRPFTAIIGASPSRGARSPSLWNAAAERCGIDAPMFAFDVNHDKLTALLQELDTTASFRGGAVTTPYKEAVAAWLGEHRLTATARDIGAVNCLFRGTDGRLQGANTDGEGALACVREHGSLSAPINVLQLGAGGAGKAVATCFAHAGHHVTLRVRQPQKVKAFARRIGADVIAWEDHHALGDLIGTIRLLINTTTVGMTGHTTPEASPLSRAHLAQLTDPCTVYDIIYDPPLTPLLAEAAQRGLATLNGTCMNLRQAIIAFRYAFPAAPLAAVTEAMATRRRALDSGPTEPVTTLTR